jgi:hypothetical protein
VWAKPHTRLTPINTGLDIDYQGIWRRARRSNVSGCLMLTLAPEDDLISRSIRGGREMWWNIKWVCDVAMFIESDLDWNGSVEQAKAQGCLRMILLAASLARHCFGHPCRTSSSRRRTSIRPCFRCWGASWHIGRPIGPTGVPETGRCQWTSCGLHAASCGGPDIWRATCVLPARNMSRFYRCPGLAVRLSSDRYSSR